MLPLSVVGWGVSPHTLPPTRTQTWVYGPPDDIINAPYIREGKWYARSSCGSVERDGGVLTILLDCIGEIGGGGREAREVERERKRERER